MTVSLLGRRIGVSRGIGGSWSGGRIEWVCQSCVGLSRVAENVLMSLMCSLLPLGTHFHLLLFDFMETERDLLPCRLGYCFRNCESAFRESVHTEMAFPYLINVGKICFFTHQHVYTFHFNHSLEEEENFSH